MAQGGKVFLPPSFLLWLLFGLGSVYNIMIGKKKKKGKERGQKCGTPCYDYHELSKSLEHDLNLPCLTSLGGLGALSYAWNKSKGGSNSIYFLFSIFLFYQKIEKFVGILMEAS
jgi:hypothetical protein